MYELPHELLNNVTLRILENQEILKNAKSGWMHNPAPSPPLRIIIIITLFKVDKNTNVSQVTSNKIAAISTEKR